MQTLRPGPLHTGLLRNALIAATPFVLGIALGLLALPADGKARERADFAGISQFGDRDCAQLARRAGRVFESAAFKVYDMQGGRVRFCDLSASPKPRAALAPRVTTGKARDYFIRVQ